MPVLKNPKHEAFANGLASGLAAEDAYSAAGYVFNPRNATRLRDTKEITVRVAELLAVNEAEDSLSAQNVLTGLLKEATREGSGSTHSARVSAWGLLGKYYRLFTDKIEADVNVNDVSNAKQRLVDLVTRHAADSDETEGSGRPH